LRVCVSEISTGRGKNLLEPVDNLYFLIFVLALAHARFEDADEPVAGHPLARGPIVLLSPRKFLIGVLPNLSLKIRKKVAYTALSKIEFLK
jgi:hypothetical protein